MNGGNVSKDKPRYTIRLMGFKPGASQEKIVAALHRITPSKSTAEIRQALTTLPLPLTRSATKEVAQKIQQFLESSGAIVETATIPPSQPASLKTGGMGQVGEERRKVPSAAFPPKEEIPAGMDDRRTKPRIHPGIKLHPMGIGEILDRSFRILRQYLWLFFIILLIPQGIFYLVNKAVHLVLGGVGGQTPSMAMGVGFGISGFFAIIIFVVLQFWAQGALIFAVSETYLGHTTSVGASYGAIWRRLGRLVGTWILMGILIVLSVFPASGVIFIAIFLKMTLGNVLSGIIISLAVIFGLWFFFRLFMNWLMVDKVVVLEGKGWMNALRRSKELMTARTEPGFWKGPRAKAALILMLGFLIAIGIHFIFQIPGLVFSFMAQGSLFVLTFQEILNIIGNALATAFTATAMILYYYDIRLRKEGFDLKMMAENI